MKGSIVKFYKKHLPPIPIWLGQILAKSPLKFYPTIGKTYNCRAKEVVAYNNTPSHKRKELIFNRMYSIVKYAIENIKFYQDFYKEKGFTLDQLKSFEDIKKIPIIDKSDLLKYDVTDRSNLTLPHYLVNTGGSTGQTLSFYVNTSQIGNEYAGFYSTFKRFDHKHSDLSLFFAGRSKVEGGVKYDLLHNNIHVDIYLPFEQTAPKIKKILRRYKIRFLHGYPSVISEFARYCNKDRELLDLLKKNLKGIVLNSEFPYPMFRDIIEETFDVPTQSFFGHTERCIIAGESKDEKWVFEPNQVYGFAEAEYSTEGEGKFDLIGTSYYNQASPLIRYNTHDVIENPKYDDDILVSFNIQKGRSGQFIVDRNGRRISLTGFLMGRHHKLFDYCSYVQVAQSENGKIIILYVPKPDQPDQKINQPEYLFDYENMDIDIEFKKLDAPIRTVSGKVSMLVKL